MIKYLLTGSVMALFVAALATPAVNAASTNYNSYVSLGDSVASGAGLGANKSRICDKSSQSYPYLVAKSLGTSVKQYACSGAKVDEGIFDTQRRQGYTIVPQLERAQRANPDLITMTIGANDVRWLDVVEDCYVWRCGSYLDKSRAVVYRADLRAELYWTMYKIEKNSDGDPPTVLLNGYYNPINKSTCSDADRITAKESAWLTEQVGYLNRSIKYIASKYDFVTYVPVDFSGHELCSTDSWIQGLDDAAPYHPTAQGQKAIANANLRALR